MTATVTSMLEFRLKRSADEADRKIRRDAQMRRHFLTRCDNLADRFYEMMNTDPGGVWPLGRY